MESLLAVPALSFGDEEHDVADLVLVGLLSGEWQALELAVARGLGLEAEHRAEVAAVEVEAALTAFRYERSLIAAAELRAWLAERQLSLPDLQAVLRRRLLREGFADVKSPAVEATAVAAVMRAEAICAGTLGRCADALRAWHAGRETLGAGFGPGDAAEPDAEALTRLALDDLPSGLPSFGAGELKRRAARLVALRLDYERFRATAVPDAAVAARVAERRLEWTAVTGTELGFELEGAALETRLHVVHDRRSLSDVAAMLDLEPARRELDLAGAPEEIGGELLAAREGDLVGPWREDDRWRVLQLERRSEPTATDERSRSRAREELLAELVERVCAGKAASLATF